MAISGSLSTFTLFFSLLLLLILIATAAADDTTEEGGAIFTVNSKFAGMNHSLSLLKAHDNLRHAQILAAGVVVPIGGTGRPDTVGDLSWSDRGGPEDYSGWEVVESPAQKKAKGFVFRLGSPFSTLHEKLRPSGTDEKSTYTGSDASADDDMDDETLPKGVFDKVNETLGVEMAPYRRSNINPIKFIMFFFYFLLLLFCSRFINVTTI